MVHCSAMLQYIAKNYGNKNPNKLNNEAWFYVWHLNKPSHTQTKWYKSRQHYTTRLNALMNEILQQHNITYGLPAYLHSLGCFEAGVSLGDNGLLPLSKDWSLFDESEMKSVSCWSNYFCQSEICHLTCFCFHLGNARVQCTLTCDQCFRQRFTSSRTLSKYSRLVIVLITQLFVPKRRCSCLW